MTTLVEASRALVIRAASDGLIPENAGKKVSQKPTPPVYAAVFVTIVINSSAPSIVELILPCPTHPRLFLARVLNCNLPLPHVTCLPHAQILCPDASYIIVFIV